MSTSRRQNRITAWLACWAITWTVLAPLFAHATATPLDRLQLAQSLCVAVGGYSDHQAGGDQPADGPARSHSAKHCPLCASTPDLPMLVGGTPVAPVVAQRQQRQIELAASSVCPPPGWQRPLAQAPPFTLS